MRGIRGCGPCATVNRWDGICRGGGGQYPLIYVGHLIRDRYTILSGRFLRIYTIIYIYRYTVRCAYVFFGARESGQVDI